MLESGSLANECCCSVGPSVPDLTPIMGSLNEALQYIALENSVNSEFGGAQGDAWPNQRTSPFDPLPSDCQSIPPDFYENDYIADIQNAYDDLEACIVNYNYVKNFFLKTDPAQGAVTLVNFTGADDYAPGTVDGSNFSSIQSAIITLVNDLLRVQAPATQVVDCCKGASATNVSTVSDWLNRQVCASATIAAGACGDGTTTENVGVSAACAFSTVDPCAATVIGGQEYTGFALVSCDACYANLLVVEGHIHGDLSNFSSADSSDIYLKLGNDITLPFSSAAIKPVPTAGTYQLWTAQAVGAIFDSATVTGSNIQIPFSFVGPTPACGPVPPQSEFGTSWNIADQVVILIRPQNCPAS